MAFSNRIPQIAAVSSDGIGDCMDSFGYKLFMREVFSKLYSLEEKVQFPDEMNEKQVKYIDSFLAYYAGQGHGAEDDCSLAFIYDPEADAPAVRLSIQEARDSWNSTARERNSVILDYERRKKAAFEELKKIMSDQDYRADSIRNKRWIELKERAEDLKRILRNMISNEKEKVTAYNRKLDFYMKQITANDEDITSMTDLKHILNLDESILIEDADYSSLKQLRKCWIEAKKAYEAAEKSAEPFSPEVLEQMKKECRSKETDYLRSVESYICMIQEKESAVQKPSGLLGSLKLRRK
jgi:vacuolar-type H+-ATPase subunit H